MSSPVIIAFLEELLRQAHSNEITEVFLWLRAGDGSTDYEFIATDVEDMLFELGTAVMTERIELPGIDQVQ